jgi:hypothetical protein
MNLGDPAVLQLKKYFIGSTRVRNSMKNNAVQ